MTVPSVVLESRFFLVPRKSRQEAEKSKCPICFMVARNALAHECGELFCEDCWVKCQGEDERCPVCRQEGHEVAPAYANRRAIQRLQIVCPNKCGQVAWRMVVGGSKVT